MKKSTQQEYTKRILGVLVFIQRNLDEELSLEEYARVAHFSPYHFHRIFRGMVGKLEAQWWLDGESCDFANAPREQWNWRLMIRTPPFVKPKELADAACKLIEKGKAPSADQVKLESITEGLCIQMLHVGPYDEERRSICVMSAFAEQQGLAFHGRHHEIYLSDPRRIAPEKLKTILRLPVRKKRT